MSHLNQPGGRFRAAIHPNVAGRERELRAMADAVRRLVRVTTNNTGDAAWTADAARRIAALADALEPALPAVPPPRYGGGAPEEPHDIFPYDVMLGIYNPLALPIEMEWQPPLAVGRASFDTPYEGPPGCVHGGYVAAAFDEVLGFAQSLTGSPGMTGRLEVVYRSPTPLHTRLRFEAWTESVVGRKITARCTLHAGERLCAEAVGLFITIKPGTFERLVIEREKREAKSKS
jgi:acyl-coenzyme A thioesterase PaaI-like protein